MTRPIRFRGKRKDNGEWVYGDLMSDGRSYWIVGPVVDASEEYISPEWWAPIIKETLGEFSGLHDKNGKEIFEGDVVLQESWAGKMKGEIYYNEEWGRFMARNNYFDVSGKSTYPSPSLEVLGNIYEHSHLLDK